MSDQVQQVIANDFSAGWCPSDSPENGRRNGLLKMDNVELDKNGVLSLTGGTSKVGSTYGSPALNLWSRSMNGVRTDYLADAAGAVFRNGTSIITGGSTLLTAFGDAYKYVLIASGSQRKKDVGSGTPINLGITKPSVAVGISPTDLATSASTVTGSIVAVEGSSAAFNPTLQTLDGPFNDNVIQTNSAGSTSPPWDLSKLTDSAGNVYASHDDDKMLFQFEGFGTLTDLNQLDYVAIDILLESPGTLGEQKENFYRFVFSPSNYEITGAGPFNVYVYRNQFERFGTAGVDWSTVYGFRIKAQLLVADATAVFALSNSNFNFQWGPSYEVQYMQVNVNSNGAYVGKSVLGPISNFTLAGAFPTITPQDPTAVDTQCNEAWIFRRGGLLPKWYRVKRVLTPFSAFVDVLSDADALTLNITYNENLTSVNSAGLAAAILSIVGPIEGRWLYFTADTMYPSDINNPDLIDTTKGVSFSNANNEIFLWANRVADDAVLVGTSLEVYLLTGTFQTLPDFTIDLYKKGLGCKHPPIVYDSTFYDGSAIYLAADGWRSISPSGESVSLTATNTDRLYRGETVQGYLSLSPAVVPGSVRYPCCVVNNRLWCGIAGTNRMEVLDLTRKYWRNVDYGVGIPKAITKSSDGYVLAHFDGSGIGAGRFLRNINLRSNLHIDATSDQPISILTPVFDGGMLRNRKDALILKARVRTGGNNLGVAVISDDGTSTNLGTISASGTLPLEKYLSASTIPVSKTYQFALTGSFSEFELSDITLDFEARPAPLTKYIFRPNNFGRPSIKRSRQWPVIIDTLGNDVTFTTRVDGSDLPSVGKSSSEKATITHFYDALGTDIGLTLTGGPFELYDIGQPDILQVNPVSRVYDFITGPGKSAYDLFRYGQVSMVRARLISQGESLPYKLFMNDRNVASGNFTCVVGEDNHYEIPVPKGTAGTTLSIEIGDPALGFTFQRFYVQVLVELRGKDTQKTWINLGGE